MKWLWLLLYVIAGAAVFFISTSTAVVYLLRDESTVACPDLTGIDAEEARSVAAQKGLSLVVASYEKKKDIPYNQVLSQTPEPAMPVKSGRTVSVVVSDGPKAVNIDSYLGLSLEEAQAALQERKIGINKIIYVPSETVGRSSPRCPPRVRTSSTRKASPSLWAAGKSGSSSCPKLRAGTTQRP